MLRFFSNDRLKEDVPKDCSLVFALVRTRRMDVLADRDRPRSSEYSYQNMSSNIIDHNCNYSYNLFKTQYLFNVPKIYTSCCRIDFDIWSFIPRYSDRSLLVYLRSVSDKLCFPKSVSIRVPVEFVLVI